MRRCPELFSTPKSGWLWLLSAAVLGICAGCSPSSNPAQGAEIEDFDYPSSGRHGTCQTGAKVGAAGATNGLKSIQGIDYNVRTPRNYDATFAHPLLMVYAPAGMDAAANESLTRLTSAATQDGFIIAYTTHRTMSLETVRKLATLPKEIADHWCIDLRRVFATGHSDGGTISTAIALLNETRGTLAAIAPSAAGFSQSDFAGFQCPSSPLPVMVMHSNADMLFHGWGADAAKWWAGCNGCDMARPPQPQGEHCLDYRGCTPGGATRYCEGTRSHQEWPGLESEIIRFFAPAGRMPLTQKMMGEKLRAAVCDAARRRSVKECTPSDVRMPRTMQSKRATYRNNILVGSQSRSALYAFANGAGGTKAMETGASP